MTALRAGVKLAGFIAMTLPGLPVQRALIALSEKGARRFPYLYHRAVTRWLGIRLNIIGEPVRDRPCLIASNHVSWLDITVLSAVTPLSFIAKKEVNSWPGFGTLARLQRTVFIDRDRRQSTSVSRDEMQERLKVGETLVLFAEGTSSDGWRVLPFKSAYFAAAEIPGVVVQPVTLAYRGHWGIPMMRRNRPLFAWYGDMEMESHLWQALAQGPIEVDVICHKPLTLAEAGNRKALARLAEDTVRRGLVEAFARP
ncbi:lysophospholipid acyltransferase family protein [Taklimakanibacter deserti]|uniref:lysophospholipid acyltransferase family protein n=1 Tax=Taklimakanibacter deserti TaxID=2267839 RepID=UPI000E64F7D3